MVSDSFIERCKKTSATIVFGPRSGSKTEEFQTPQNLAPGKLQNLIPVKVLSVETLRGDISETLHYEGQTFHSNRWREELDVDNKTKVLATYHDHTPAVVQAENRVYVGTLGCADFTRTLLEKLAKASGLTTYTLPEDVRTVERGDYRLLFNYSAEAVRVDGFANKEFVIGSNELPGYSYAVMRRG